ncbi:aminoglycoside N(3)-acetyltransferase [Microbispora hainanensis]|uniref:Aminoglycoside N(3)-acetyltransferase n=1 Tax=Microbispora hainanensis TaxID=568844 RepID=A0A544YNH3_9ACTN|nr:AAC(3) family N-acetyltransferase [Microbispora hainanensis]TQS18338.1 AAC(3) family N-acetyltransferase [Microbispora hainanensis]
MRGLRLSALAFVSLLSRLSTISTTLVPPASPERLPGPLKHGFGQDALVHSLRRLGLRSGQTALVHASLRSIGTIDGGVATLAGALMRVLGAGGTLVVPTFTSGNSETSHAYRAVTRGMTDEEIRAYRDSMPAFDVRRSSAIECGSLAEHVRLLENAVRSEHPQTSFAAVGPTAESLMAGHDLTCHLGERSPLAKLAKAEAVVLLLGVGFDKCSAFHLAEYRYRPDPPEVRYGCVVQVDGRRTWTYYQDVVLDDRDFAECGAEMERTEKIRRGRVGKADSRLFSLPKAVAFAERWLSEKRGRAAE